MRKGFMHKGEILTIYETKYLGGAKAIELLDSNEEPYTRLTTNIPGTPLKENEILVKTWSENEEVADSALKSGIFRDTGKRVRSGWVEAQVWQMIETCGCCDGKGKIREIEFVDGDEQTCRTCNGKGYFS